MKLFLVIQMFYNILLLALAGLLNTILTSRTFFSHPLNDSVSLIFFSFLWSLYSTHYYLIYYREFDIPGRIFLLRW
jgi:hypothetical protein